MSKPCPVRTYSVCVKPQKGGGNSSTFSLYSNVLSLDELHKLFRLMIIDEHDKYVDIHNRYVIDQSDPTGATHNIQIFKFEQYNCIDSRSFSFKENAYSACEIAEILEAWLSQKLREKSNLKFADGKVKNYLRRCLTRWKKEQK